MRDPPSPVDVAFSGPILGKANVAGAVLNIDRTAKKNGIAGHESSFPTKSSMVNSTKGILGKILWKTFPVETKPAAEVEINASR